MTQASPLPGKIRNEAELEDLLTTPSQELIEFAGRLSGTLAILGVGGKMGPTLAIRAKRAIDAAGSDVQMVAISRFSNPETRRWLDDRGVNTIAADLLDQDSYANLPDAGSVIYLVGTKFGTGQNPSLTWAVNTVAPTYAMQRYAQSEFVALSTGNVYAFTPSASGGSQETDSLQPVGEYANAAVGRERIFDHFSRRNGTPVAMIRLNYATDLRYGVIIDLACKVANRQPVDLSQGYFNCIWQGDANDLILRALDFAESPPRPINITSLETFAVREVATRFGELMNREVRFVGQEAPDALLSNAALSSELLGAPPTPMDRVLEWAADWVSRGERLLGKATHFEVRDGGF